MNAAGKHDCFNRVRRDAYLAPARVYSASGDHFAIVSKETLDRSSRECQYSKDVVDAHCVGCKHNQKELGEPRPAPGV